MNEALKVMGLAEEVRTGAMPWARTAAVFTAVLLGIVMIYGVGFAGSEVVHNAAHDLRHSLAFPCH